MELWRKQYQQDRATELAAKVQKELEHKDKLQFAKQSIMDVQLAAGEPDFFVKDVVASIEKQGALLKVWQCGEIPETIDDKLLQTFQMKAKSCVVQRQTHEGLSAMVPFRLAEGMCCPVCARQHWRFGFERLVRGGFQRACVA